MTLIEVAEGIDPRRDVLDQMGFTPQVAEPLGRIDPRVYERRTMGLAEDYAR